jgi:hypothetical protein
MSTESLKRTPEKIETLLINEGVLKHTSVKPNIPKRPCINALKRRLHDSKKKDQLKNKLILCTIFFSVGAIGFIVG